MEIFGWAATIVVSLQFIPQLVKTIKTKNAKDISLFMIFLIMFGNVLWIMHGLIVLDMPITITNSMIFVMMAILLVLKLKYK